MENTRCWEVPGTNSFLLQMHVLFLCLWILLLLTDNCQSSRTRAGTLVLVQPLHTRPALHDNVHLSTLSPEHWNLQGQMAPSSVSLNPQDDLFTHPEHTSALTTGPECIFLWVLGLSETLGVFGDPWNVFDILKKNRKLAEEKQNALVQLIWSK